MEALSENFGWIEILFTALVAFGFGGWQYWSVSREIERDKQAKDEAKSTGGARHTIGEHELDDR
ncbi:hypothetical protein [Qipengyuania qiaonensis]|uniref:hypothetical protein n=1 Tax=Qipengyuania qiaonensis TaxID=2867240 RepID=UPI001C86EAD0|nr:hypothetical protein [Qipengyuania qiaonensis]